MSKTRTRRTIIAKLFVLIDVFIWKLAIIILSIISKVLYILHLYYELFVQTVFCSSALEIIAKYNLAKIMMSLTAHLYKNVYFYVWICITSCPAWLHPKRLGISYFDGFQQCKISTLLVKNTTDKEILNFTFLMI